MTETAHPTSRWNWDDTRSLHGRAVAWMLLVTLPLAAVVGLGAAVLAWPDSITLGGSWWAVLGHAVVWAALVDGVSLVAVLVAALVTLPVTHGVELLLDRWAPDRGPVVRVVVSAVVAGVLASAPMACAGVGGLVVTAPVCAAAGAAGALARWRTLHRDQAARSGTSRAGSGPGHAARIAVSRTHHGPPGR